MVNRARLVNKSKPKGESNGPWNPAYWMTDTVMHNACRALVVSDEVILGSAVLKRLWLEKVMSAKTRSIKLTNGRVVSN